MMPTHTRDHTDCGAWRVNAAEKVRQRQAADRAQKDWIGKLICSAWLKLIQSA
jgi:hypothetical protein